MQKHTQNEKLKLKQSFTACTRTLIVDFMFKRDECMQWNV